MDLRRHRRRSGGVLASPTGKVSPRKRSMLDFSGDEFEAARSAPPTNVAPEPLSRIKNRLADAAARSLTPPHRPVKSPTLDLIQSSARSRAGGLFAATTRSGALHTSSLATTAADGTFMACADDGGHSADTDLGVAAIPVGGGGDVPATPRISQGILHRQRQLEDQHYASKSKASDRLASGGGISPWPLMSDMRLTSRDASFLCLLNLLLLPLVVSVFLWLHGGIAADLLQFTQDVAQFNSRHIIPPNGSDVEFRLALLAWHNDFLNLTDHIEHSYDTPFWQMDTFRQLIIVLYMLFLFVLVYYLFENVVSASRLTPKRIKLCVESAIKEAVLDLSQELPRQISTSHNLAPFTALIQHWTLRALPPTGPGILSLWGSLRIPDIVHYLQFYSWPFVAALITPIFKLVLSLKTVYSAGVTI
ncbi:uncharacterized protein LOC135819155 isoform X2 [Sycon ciliatum]|uniref:uncharacterized protein LOC135819155 isoform X2 n=1 Tax=Sycon ciliatum TaxID=27933 RepID=UPI0031F69560